MKRYVLVGTGIRGYQMFAKPIIQNFSSHAELVGLYDINSKRAHYVQQQLNLPIPVFDNFDEMLDQQKPDCVIIATVDAFHGNYILSSLASGCQVICEKPIVITAEECNQIIKAEKETGIQTIVTFNCRFMPSFSHIKSLLLQGIIGTVQHVNLEWFLDRSHGADYFRRWHRRIENSGSLLVHKSTHHFDIVNWFVDQKPDEVFAQGELNFYGQADRQFGIRCCKCPQKQLCNYAYPDVYDADIQGLYFHSEDEDNYYRDRCIFDPEINIWDTMSLCVRYDRGAMLTYSLNAYSPYEGWKISITGSKGRLESEEFYSGMQAKSSEHSVRIYFPNGSSAVYYTPLVSGMHGGGDDKLRKFLFEGTLDDPLHQAASSREGILSALIGIAAGKSILNRKPIQISSLLDNDFN